MTENNKSSFIDNKFHDESGNCAVATARDEILDHYLLAEMSAEESAALVEHLLFCSACNRELRLREVLLATLQEEGQVASPYMERAGEIAALRPAGYPKPAGREHFSPGFRWLAAAAVLLLAVSLALFFGVFRTDSSPRQLLSRLEQSDYKPYHLQDAADSRWDDYNRGLNLLFKSQQRRWWQAGYPEDRQSIAMAITSLEAAFRQGLPDDVRMDICAYLFRAHIMLGQDDIALSWLEKSTALAANRSKLKRALELSQRFEAVLLAEAGEPPSDVAKNLLVRCRYLQQVLRSLIAQ